MRLEMLARAKGLFEDVGTAALWGNALYEYSALFDSDPATRATEPNPVRVFAPPSRRALVAGHLNSLRTALTAAARYLPHLPDNVRQVARQVRNAASDVRATAPITSLPRRVGPGRRALLCSRNHRPSAGGRGRSAPAEGAQFLLKMLSSC